MQNLKTKAEARLKEIHNERHGLRVATGNLKDELKEYERRVQNGSNQYKKTVSELKDQLTVIHQQDKALETEAEAQRHRVQAPQLYANPAAAAKQIAAATDKVRRAAAALDVALSSAAGPLAEYGKAYLELIEKAQAWQYPGTAELMMSYHSASGALHHHLAGEGVPLGLQHQARVGTVAHGVGKALDDLDSFGRGITG